MLWDDIRKLNMDYFLLARDLIREDRLTAMHILGLDDDSIDLIKDLSPIELSKMADTNVLLCQFRLRDKMLLQMLKEHAGGFDEHGHTHALLIGNSQAANEEKP